MIVQTFNRERPRLMVVSHERSGTHFLMNSIAKCFDYVVEPWINFDYELGLNFHDPESVARFFAGFRGHWVANIVKSHHPASFFEGAIDSILSDVIVFYVYRDPRDVMTSYWRFLRQLPWDEGPKCETLSEFVRSAPSGAMLRYQKQQEPTVVHRWLTHVVGWMNLAAAVGPERVRLVGYHEMYFDFERVMADIGSWIGEPPGRLERPSPHQNTILPHAARVGSYNQAMSREDSDWIVEIAGSAMTRLGLSI